MNLIYKKLITLFTFYFIAMISRRLEEYFNIYLFKRNWLFDFNYMYMIRSLWDPKSEVRKFGNT